MNDSYLLDTNICSFLIRAQPVVVKRLLGVPKHRIAISTVTEAELRFGVERRPGATRLADAVGEFLVNVQIHPWDSQVARRYAILRSELEKRGRSMHYPDMMIASHALALDAVLVSNDQIFRSVRGLRLEDWTRA